MEEHHFVSSLGHVLRLCLAHVQLIIFFVLGVVDWAIPFFDHVRPYFLWMAFYYWTIYRPTLWPPIYVFIFGLLIDLLLSMPFGLNAFLLVGMLDLISIFSLTYLSNNHRK